MLVIVEAPTVPNTEKCRPAAQDEAAEAVRHVMARASSASPQVAESRGPRPEATCTGSSLFQHETGCEIACYFFLRRP